MSGEWNCSLGTPNLIILHYSPNFFSYCIERKVLGQWTLKPKTWKWKKIWCRKVSYTHFENHLAVALLVHFSVFWSWLPQSIQHTFMSTSWDPCPVPGSKDTKTSPWRSPIHWGFRPGRGIECNTSRMMDNQFHIHREGVNILAGSGRPERTLWKAKDILDSDWLQITLEQHRRWRELERETS